MYFVRTVVFGAVLGLALAGSQAPAQEKSFKEAIIGPHWSLDHHCSVR
jgi:hypothetical protein